MALVTLCACASATGGAGPELAGAERAYQGAWLTEAVRTFGRCPNLAGVVYFNAVNPPNTWMGDQPD